MERVFIDDKGMWYKAEKPVEKSHAERSVVTEEFLSVLTAEPRHLVDIEADVATLLAKKG